MEEFEVEVRKALGDPKALEALFRKDRTKFSHVIRRMEETEESWPALGFWRARLDYKSSFDLKAILGLAVAGLLCWLPLRLFQEFPASDSENFVRYFPSIFFAGWGSAFFFLERRLKPVWPLLAMAAVVAVFFGFLPSLDQSQSRPLAVLHSYLLLWCAIPLAVSWVPITRSEFGRNYIEKTGEALFWAVLFLIGGVLLTVVTLGLFRALGLEISDFYFKNVVTMGLVLAPFLGLYFAGDFVELKISHVLARVFAPLAAATVTVFLILALISYGKLFSDKEAFVFYSLVPIFVVAIIFFVNLKPGASKVSWILNLYLSSIATLFVVLVIPPTIFRISTWGITPNKITILGIEILLLANLLSILANQILVLRSKKEPGAVAASIVQFVPLYFVWSVVVVGVFPFVFGFK